ncbi:ankyrin repeat domain-containing protein [Endozoicomonas sp.]|uniref:ankyrin repeat domain-containing protein n=1 Tax=Endozoicomonas sp. TaxID=1892382 RepID=UPI002885BD9F|nr:ankyrin repeat domain-containing protein [Endozoicomonas sp.]
MGTPVTQLQTTFGPNFKVPESINSEHYQVSTTIWDKKAFGMVVRLVCPSCRYLGSFLAPQDKALGLWGSPTKTSLNHSKYCHINERSVEPVNYSKKENRLKSFESDSWQQHSSSQCNDAEALAKQGLYYLGIDDFVSCADCHFTGNQLKKFNISNRHQTKTKLPCQFLKNEISVSIESAYMLLKSDQLQKFNNYIEKLDDKRKQHQLEELAKLTITSGRIMPLMHILSLSDERIAVIKDKDIKKGIAIFAIQQNQSGALKTILDSGILSKNKSPETVYFKNPEEQCLSRLALTIEMDRLDMTQMLINYGNKKQDNPHSAGLAREDKKLTNWEFCLHRNKLNALKLFIKNDLDLTRPLHTGELPIHIAAALNKLPAVQCFVESGADINAPTQEKKIRPERPTASENTPAPDTTIYTSTPHKQTALHLSAMRNATEAYQWLLDNGADATLTDSHGKTASDYLKDHESAPPPDSTAETTV